MLLPWTSKLVRTPSPAGITTPEKEKPKTTPVSELTEVEKPASAAIPPEALITVAPFTLNWNPPRSTSLL